MQTFLYKIEYFLHSLNALNVSISLESIPLSKKKKKDVSYDDESIYEATININKEISSAMIQQA